jgi:hypothetical protein
MDGLLVTENLPKFLSSNPVKAAVALRYQHQQTDHHLHKIHILCTDS